MPDSKDFAEFISLLEPDGPIALIIRQELAPDDEEERVIFPPTYPLTSFKGRIQRFEQGEYRVSIELPPDSRRDKDEKRDNQKPGYQIDRFPDGTNVCEIDSIQSQSNRIEPQFKTIKDGKLVPQITIDVGSGRVSLLDAGHRAADAVVRMSSLAADFHDAWTAAKSGDVFPLATLAPTAIVFGAWDSRSTQAKLQRLVKAHIRATNVQERTRSAQYTPAVDYVASGAVDENVSAGEDDKNNLSQEGMKHALSTQTAGGVALTATSKLTRTVNLNLAAVRQLRALGERAPLPENSTPEEQARAREAEKTSADGRTKLLREYILALALVAAYSHPSLNLREGCNLQTKGCKTTLVQDRRKEIPAIDESNVGPRVEAFALHAAERFFAATTTNFAEKDRHAVFESGVAEQFLAMPTGDRDKVRALGPITAETLKRFAEQGKDPFRSVADAVKGAREVIGRPPGRGKPRVKNLEALKPVARALTSMLENLTLDDDARQLAQALAATASEHEDSHVALKEIESKIKEFRRSKKADAATEPQAEGGAQS